MAKNLVACGDVLDYLIPSGEVIESGDPVLVNDVMGVALVSGVEGEIISVQLEGVFSLPKKTHASNQALAQGDAVFFDHTDGKVTNTSNGGLNPQVGVAYNDALSTSASANVRLGAGTVLPAAANVAAIGIANGSDAATTQALANETKTTVNAILTALKAKGIMVADA